MGRRSFIGVLNQIARESARQQRQAEAERRRLERERVNQERAVERAIVLSQKEANQRYLEARADQAAAATRDQEARVAELRAILADTLAIDDTISFESLKLTSTFREFAPPAALAWPAPAPRCRDFRPGKSPPGFLGKLLPSLQARYERSVEASRLAFAEATATHSLSEQHRQAQLAVERERYDRARDAHDAKISQQNREIDDFEEAYRSADPKAVVGYCSMVLERSRYPDGFPHEFRAAYVPESKQLVVEYELPGPSVIPAVAEFRYVKSKDEIQEKPRRPADVRELYQEVVAATTLRTCHELFESDQGRHIESLAFSGFVQTVDRATGRDARPCLISLRVTRDRFLELDLGRIDTRVCLRNLGASVSPRPDEIQPVKPLIDFDMVDRRFVEQSDVLSEIESRPNLMDLTPYEFENLVANLFSQLGLETRATRSSRDGGVDAVAFDTRPVLGGKLVIQAKRYKNTVGVSAVRDLYGTMQHEGANKGILVTTSGYGPDAFDFVADKPVELIDGGQLLYLLAECGVQARIVFPEDWTDP